MSELPIDIPPGLEAFGTRVIRNAVHHAVKSLRNNELEGSVRPWDLPALRRDAATLTEVEAAQVVSVDEQAMVEMEHFSEDLGQGDPRSISRYQWSDGGRDVLAEHIKDEIYDGATPYMTFVRGVVVDDDRRGSPEERASG
jgi:hypothetical protein